MIFRFIWMLFRTQAAPIALLEGGAIAGTDAWVVATLRGHPIAHELAQYSLMASSAVCVFAGVMILVNAAIPFEEKIVGRCPTCGYDLRATPDRCPECGTAVARD